LHHVPVDMWPQNTVSHHKKCIELRIREIMKQGYEYHLDIDTLRYTATSP
jgi:hypothetical protein